MSTTARPVLKGQDHADSERSAMHADGEEQDAEGFGARHDASGHSHRDQRAKAQRLRGRVIVIMRMGLSCEFPAGGVLRCRPRRLRSRSAPA